MRPGDHVQYEVAKRDGTSFAVPAVVVAVEVRRIEITYNHWRDGRPVTSRVRPHRVREATA